MRSPVPLSGALALAFSLVLAPAAGSQPRPEGGGVFRLEGTVISIDKEASRFTLRQRGRTNMAWRVRYTESTSFSYRNAATSVEDVKVGRRVICLGRFGEEEAKAEMTAAVVDVRSGK